MGKITELHDVTNTQKELDEAIKRPSFKNVAALIKYADNQQKKLMDSSMGKWEKSRKQLVALEEDLSSLFFGAVEMRGFLDNLQNEYRQKGEDELADKIFDLKRKADEMEDLADAPKAAFREGGVAPMGAMKREMKSAYAKMEKLTKEIVDTLKKLGIK